jgi:hypothetical protein
LLVKVFIHLLFRYKVISAMKKMNLRLMYSRCHLVEHCFLEALIGIGILVASSCIPVSAFTLYASSSSGSNDPYASGGSVTPGSITAIATSGTTVIGSTRTISTSFSTSLVDFNTGVNVTNTFAENGYTYTGFTGNSIQCQASGANGTTSCVQPTSSTIAAPSTGSTANTSRYLFVSGDPVNGGGPRPALTIAPTNASYFGLLWGGGGLTGASTGPNANDRIVFNFLGGGSTTVTAAQLNLSATSYVNFYSDTLISSINFSTSGFFSFRSDNHRFNTSSNPVVVPEPVPMVTMAGLMLGGLLVARRKLAVAAQKQPYKADP